MQLDANVLYTQDGQVFTSAGECAGLDLCLHLVRLDHGSRIANALARRMVLPPHREGGQAQYMDSPRSEIGHRRPDAGLGACSPRRALRIDDLATEAAMSRRTFQRHFRALTATTPLQWLLQARIARGAGAHGDHRRHG